ncbi:protein lethal(3)malignant blood neoplasm 1 isoform X2 [Toxorhynchites rutilus septentrionalis]|uniref:protein lethal(3)malignant blood neoplasm 1 isoform X2 n=1 Tax=Toxorhynchites rutilus septentrionalis TaxID=329112 RepID=UPI00247B2D33|nr:protein lethal(3)malignant blood neoplasm 1 isoform X2 [Toxorhynchites rutilus septentrionalis]
MLCSRCVFNRRALGSELCSLSLHSRFRIMTCSLVACVQCCGKNILTVVLLTLLSLVKAASKYYDGPIRPYEFGFNIEGHHHRKESKDLNGIIMGEFGFVTADNVYHVTVYATDENGNFKIVSMKNYKLGPIMPPTAGKTKATTTPSTTPQPFRIITTAKPPMSSRPAAVAGCSGCRIPETTTVAKQQPTDSTLPETSTQYVPPFKIVNKNDLESITTTIAPKLFMTTQVAGGSSKETPQKLIVKQQSSKESTNDVKSPNAMQSLSKTPQLQTSAEKTAQKTSQPSKPSSATPSGSGSTGSKLDHTEAAKMMIQHILNGLLYRFNYTVGYHGHHEQGDRAGNKEGGYFAIGRDGVRRGVTYTANEFGFQPHIKFDQVSPEETPREDTEKQAGLKGFDFKWFWGESR